MFFCLIRSSPLVNHRRRPLETRCTKKKRCVDLSPPVGALSCSKNCGNCPLWSRPLNKFGWVKPTLRALQYCTHSHGNDKLSNYVVVARFCCVFEKFYGSQPFTSCLWKLSFQGDCCKRTNFSLSPHLTVQIIWESHNFGILRGMVYSVLCGGHVPGMCFFYLYHTEFWV